MIVDDLESVAAGNPSVAALAAEGWRTILMAPLRIETDLVGNVAMLWKTGGVAVEDHTAWLSEISTTVAVGLRQIQLRESAAVAQAALEGSARRLRELIDGLGPSMFVGLLDVDGLILEANRPALLAAGLQPEDVIGKPFEEAPWWSYSPEVQRQLREAMRRAASGVPSRYDVQMMGTSGTPFWIDFSLQPIPGPDGRPVYLVASATVIEERKRAEQDAVRRAAALAAVRAVAGELQMVRPTQGLAVAAIDVLETLVGHTYGAILLIDQTTGRLVPFALSDLGRPGDRAAIDADIATIEAVDVRVGRGVTGWVAEHGESVRLGDTGADPRYLDVRSDVRSELCVPIRAGERVIGVVNVESNDVDAYSADDQVVLETVASQIGIALQNARLLDELTGRVEQLRRATLQLTAIASVTELVLQDLPFDGMLEALVRRVRDALSSDVATVLLLDAEAETLVVRASVGMKRRSSAIARIAVGDGFAGRIAAERRPIVVTDAADFDFVGPNPFRQLRSLVGVPLTIGDQLIGVLHVGSRSARTYDDDDVRLLTLVAERAAASIERARLTAELARYAEVLEDRVETRTAELSEINAELDAFSYSVSHDLRAPLRAMHGFAGALIEDEAERLSEPGLDYATRIVAAAGRMELLIDDLLAYGRLARADLRITSVGLDRVLADALEQLDSAIRDTGARVHADGRLGEVRGHGPTLVQVVANLLGNALKYVPAGTTPEIVVRAEVVAGARRLWVEDNGLGIATEHHGRIFRPFERLHGVEAYAGTGIGLAVVRRGVERMGGSCGVESQLGQGSRFWVELPEGGRP